MGLVLSGGLGVVEATDVLVKSNGELRLLLLLLQLHVFLLARAPEVAEAELNFVCLLLWLRWREVPVMTFTARVPAWLLAEFEILPGRWLGNYP